MASEDDTLVGSERSELHCLIFLQQRLGETQGLIAWLTRGE